MFPFLSCIVQKGNGWLKVSTNKKSVTKKLRKCVGLKQGQMKIFVVIMKYSQRFLSTFISTVTTFYGTIALVYYVRGTISGQKNLNKLYFLINSNEMFFLGMSVLWIVLKYDTLFSSSICWDEETSFEMFRMRFEDKTFVFDQNLALKWSNVFKFYLIWGRIHSNLF